MPTGQTLCPRAHRGRQGRSRGPVTDKTLWFFGKGFIRNAWTSLTAKTAGAPLRLTSRLTGCASAKVISVLAGRTPGTYASGALIRYLAVAAGNRRDHVSTATGQFTMSRVLREGVTPPRSMSCVLTHVRALFIMLSPEREKRPNRNRKSVRAVKHSSQHVRTRNSAVARADSVLTAHASHFALRLEHRPCHCPCPADRFRRRIRRSARPGRSCGAYRQSFAFGSGTQTHRRRHRTVPEGCSRSTANPRRRSRRPRCCPPDP